jgi:hypothetical protein
MAGVLNMKAGYVFIHVPKCAGASMTSVLLDSDHSFDFGSISALEPIVQQENIESREEVKLILHARARDIRNFLGTPAYESLESFAVVRNPWDRLKSHYHYARVPPSDLANKFPGRSFGDFIIWACEKRPSTMHDRLVDKQGRLIVKNILKFEALESDFKKFSDMFSFDFGKLPHKNTSSNSHEKTIIPDSLVDMVKRTYERDFSLFDYPIDPPEN